MIAARSKWTFEERLAVYVAESAALAANDSEPFHLRTDASIVRGYVEIGYSEEVFPFAHIDEILDRMRRRAYGKHTRRPGKWRFELAENVRQAERIDPDCG